MRRPEVFGKYQMLSRIASGGMAEVWLARSSSIGGFEKLVAIKRMHPKLFSNDAFVSMFIDEAKLTVSLSHPNIVQVFDFGRVDDDYFMAMEFIDGIDLAALAKRARRAERPLPIGVCVFIMRAVFDGLAHAHDRRDWEGNPTGIVHRDVSPQNVLLSFDGTVKIGDFGIAKAKSELADVPEGEVFGKIAYCSPEQCRGDTVDGATDIWGGGVVLHEILSNNRLFAKANDYDTLDAVEGGTIPNPSAYNPAVPPELDALVLEALIRDPDKRLTSARAAAERLALIQNKYFPTATQYQLTETIQDMWGGKLPRLLTPARPPPSAQTRSHRRPSSTQPVGDMTAAQIAAVVHRQDHQIRRDSHWTKATEPEIAAGPESEFSTATELDMEMVEETLPGGLTPERQIEHMMHAFLDRPNLWVLVDIGITLEDGGLEPRALGAFKLAAARFAQRGLLLQAATIYRHILCRWSLDEPIREEIKRLTAFQGMSDADLLAEVFDSPSGNTDFSDVDDLFERGSEPVEIFAETPILSSLNGEQLVRLIPALALRRYSAGELIVKEGDPGDSFFMLGRGRVLVSGKNFEGKRISLTSLSDGDCFGEHGFFTGQPRTATVEALSEVMILEVQKSVLNRVIQEYPSVRESLRRFYRDRIAESLLAKSELFGGLSVRARRMLAEHFTFESYSKGDLVIREGDQSDAFYAIKAGSVRVYVGEDEQPVHLDDLTAGEVFGEIAAIEGTKRTATVRALEKCELLRLEAAELNAMLAKNIEIRKMIEAKISERSEKKIQKLIEVQN